LLELREAEAHFEDSGTGFFKYRVVCPACGCATQFFRLASLAMKAWNEAARDDGVLRLPLIIHGMQSRNGVTIIGTVVAVGTIGGLIGKLAFTTSSIELEFCVADQPFPAAHICFEPSRELLRARGHRH
jgi:hypothetical protein